MPKLLQKLTFSFLSALIVLFSLAPYFAASAQIINGNPVGENGSTSTQTAAPTAAPKGTWYNANFSQWFTKVYDPNVSPESEIFGERYTAAQVQWVIFGLVAFLINSTGDAGSRAVSCLMSGDLGSCGSAIEEAINKIKLTDAGSSTWASAWSANKLSGVGYVKQKIDSFHLIPEAKAQGFGYSAVSPIQTLWVAIRNLSFGLIILVVIAMAFMIMFRVKISPQVVITVQSALPKIIGALVLITFSYAIAGFMIDLMYVVMGILSVFLSSSGLTTLSAPDLFNFLNTSNIFFLLVGYLFYFTLGMVVALFSNYGFLGFMVGSILVLIVLAVLVVIVIVSTLKIMWLLLVTFVNILVQIAFAPILILVGTMSSVGGFGAWLTSLAANLAVYPTVGFLFFISFFFLAQAYGQYLVIGNVAVDPAGIISLIVKSFPFSINPLVLERSATWSPPLTMGAKGLAVLWLGASFAVLALIPKTAEIIKGLISGKPFAYGTAIGEAAAPVGALGLGLLNRESARQQAAYRKAMEDRTLGASERARYEAYNRFWSFIRGTSRGDIK